MYKSIYYSLYRSIEKLGGRNYHLRTNSLLSFILSLIYASALLIYSKISGNQVRQPGLSIFIFVTGCFLGNYLLIGRKDRDVERPQEIERNPKTDRFGRLMTLILIITALVSLTIE